MSTCVSPLNQSKTTPSSSRLPKLTSILHYLIIFLINITPSNSTKYKFRIYHILTINTKPVLTNQYPNTQEEAPEVTCPCHCPHPFLLGCWICMGCWLKTAGQTCHACPVRICNGELRVEEGVASYFGPVCSATLRDRKRGCRGCCCCLRLA